MAKCVEIETRDHSKSKLWYSYSSGRIAASKMKVVCRTDLSNPSQSLIKAIANPEVFKF